MGNDETPKPPKKKSSKKDTEEGQVEHSLSRTFSNNPNVKTVLISVDGSKFSARACDWYVKNMWKPEDHVVFFHVAEPARLPSVSVTSPVAMPVEEWKKIMEERIYKIKKIEDEFVGRAIEMKMKYTFIHETNSKVGEGICHFVKSKQIDMIVMGTRGLGKIRRTFLGSVSDYVLHHAGKPVAVIPPDCSSK